MVEELEMGDAMAQDDTTIVLVPSLKTAAAGPLLENLRQRRGSSVNLDGSGVEFLGAACFQVLASASASWAKDSIPFSIVNPSNALRTDLAILGAGNLVTIEEEAI